MRSFLFCWNFHSSLLLDRKRLFRHKGIEVLGNKGSGHRCGFFSDCSLSSRGFSRGTGPFLKKASSAAYGAYIVNVPCVITLQALFHPIEAHVLVQFLAVCVLDNFGSSFRIRISASLYSASEKSLLIFCVEDPL